MTAEEERLIPVHGGYRKLKSFQIAQLVYEDFLRQRELPKWEREDQRRQELIDCSPATAEDIAKWTKNIHDSNLRI